jgi:putative phosphoesterase
MRVLVVSDIHGNWEALRTVAESEKVDRVVCLGDAVDYGPRSPETVRWVREHSGATVRGNHDNAVAMGVSCRSAPLFRRLSEETRKLTAPMLDEGEKQFLSLLPTQRDLELEGLKLALLHAAPSDPLFRYLPATERAAWEREIEPIEADLILVGHTHLPVVMRFGKKTVVNPGSVGLPRDGDPRASYAVLDDGEPRLRRMAYDVSRTVDDLWKWGLPQDVARSLERIYRSGSLEG